MNCVLQPSLSNIDIKKIDDCIYYIRGDQVMLDS